MAIGFAFLAMVIGSAAVLAVGWLGLTEKLPRNYIAGIRIGYSMQDDAHWREVHRAAGPYMVLSSAAVLAASLSFLPFALLGKIPESLGAVVLLGSAVFILAAVLVSTVIGVKKAKQTFGD